MESIIELIDDQWAIFADIQCPACLYPGSLMMRRNSAGEIEYSCNACGAEGIADEESEDDEGDVQRMNRYAAQLEEDAEAYRALLLGAALFAVLEDCIKERKPVGDSVVAYWRDLIDSTNSSGTLVDIGVDAAAVERVMQQLTVFLQRQAGAAVTRHKEQES